MKLNIQFITKNHKEFRWTKNHTCKQNLGFYTLLLHCYKKKKYVNSAFMINAL